MNYIFSKLLIFIFDYFYLYYCFFII